jgi:hypothetical protein
LIFFPSLADRVVDVLDGLPKWETVLEGNIIPEKSPENKKLPVQEVGIAHKIKDEHKSSDSDSSRALSWSKETGRVRKDVLPLSPVRPVEPKVYHFPESDPPVNIHTMISPESVQARVEKKYYPSPGVYVAPSKVYTNSNNSSII